MVPDTTAVNLFSKFHCCAKIDRPNRTVRGIHAGGAPFAQELPGCQRNGVVEGEGFRREVPGEDRTVVKEERDAMSGMAGSVQDLERDLARDAQRAPRDAEARLREIKVVLIRTMISDQLAYVNIAKEWFNISDLREIRSRRIGSGKIGGKSAGMLLAKRILDGHLYRRGD